jgi:hypothetical protein
MLNNFGQNYAKQVGFAIAEIVNSNYICEGKAILY